jgi:hypothetical protein
VPIGERRQVKATFITGTERDRGRVQAVKQESEGAESNETLAYTGPISRRIGLFDD